MKKVLSKSSFALIVITLSAVIIYSNIYQAPFVLDDLGGIQENLDIRDVGNYLSVDRLLKPRDIVNLTFALNYRFGKLDVFGYHLINVLIHIINGFLAYFLALTIFRRVFRPNAGEDDNSAREGLQIKAERSKLKGRWTRLKANFQSTIDNRQSSIYLMSLFTALIFIAHPIQTQAVTYTVQRCASMAAMFYLASVFFYLKARIIQQRAVDGGQRSEGKGQRSAWRRALSFQVSAYFLISIICGILAFLSKQNTASLPGVILLVEYLLIDRTWEGWKWKIPWFVSVFTLWAVFVLYISAFFSGGIEGRGLLEDVSALMQETEYVSRWSYLCTQFNVLVIYIRLLFLPIGQNLDYVYRFNNTFFDGYTPLAFAFLVGVIAIGILNIRKRPVISFGIFWFFITLLVESSFIPISDALFEHRLYLPMFGLAILVSYLVFYFLSKRILWALLVSGVIVLCLGTATYLRNRVWQNKITLWTDVVSKNPQNARGHNNLGIALDDEDLYDKARYHYSEALRINPGFPQAHCNLGRALARQGDLKSAIGHYSEALRLVPDFAEAHYNLGITLVQQGDAKSAVSHFFEALRIEPNYADAHYNLGVTLYKQGRVDDAARHFSESLKIKPDCADAHNNLGNALVQKRRLKEAASHYSQALRINPGFAEARHNLEIILRWRARLAGRKFEHTLKQRDKLNEVFE